MSRIFFHPSSLRALMLLILLWQSWQPPQNSPLKSSESSSVDRRPLNERKLLATANVRRRHAKYNPCFSTIQSIIISQWSQPRSYISLSSLQSPQPLQPINKGSFIWEPKTMFATTDSNQTPSNLWWAMKESSKKPSSQRAQLFVTHIPLEMQLLSYQEKCGTMVITIISLPLMSILPLTLSEEFCWKLFKTQLSATQQR